MKKILMIGMISLLLISLVTAILLTDKQSALNYMATMRSQRATAIEQAIDTITFTENVRCVYLTIDSEEALCFAYFTYGDNITARVKVNETMGLKEIDSLAQQYVKDQIEYNYTNIRVEYTSQEIKDRVVSIK